MQTQEQAIQQINIWAEQKQIKDLAQDEHNIQLLLNYLRLHFNGVATVSNLNQAVASLYQKLNWYGTAPATPKLRGSIAEKLWQMGHGKSTHLSYSEKAELDKESENRLSNSRDTVAAIAQRHELVKQLYEAEHIVVTRPAGPFAGRTDYAATERERVTETERIRQKIRQFNQKHPDLAIKL